MGVDGQRQVVVDNRGREREVMGIKDAIPGKNLQLTLDLDLQAVAELAMEGRRGAVVALDPRTGEVLAMVSRPSFDPNKFAGRIKPADWKEIADNPDHPLLNRAIQAQLAPGSTFKPIMALAGLETGAIDDTSRCTVPAGPLSTATTSSATEGRPRLRLPAQRHRPVLRRVLLQRRQPTGHRQDRAVCRAMSAWVTRPASTCRTRPKALVPSTRWKMRNFRQKWYAGETISVSIGQGALTVTPAATGARHRGHGGRRGMAPSAPAAAASKTEKPDTCQARPGERARR